MDKSILKKFAIESRQDLMSKISNKIKTFYVDEEFKKEQKGEVYLLSNEKHSLSLTKEENEKRDLLIKRINELTLEQVIEEAAYTWFNRLIAIRYMEINDMLPLTKNNSSLGIRVLSSRDNTPDPEILKFTNLTNPDLDIDFRKEKYVELKDDNEKFKYVLLLICKKLGKVIPQVFDGNTDYIDILIPDNLLNDAGFITKIINDVPEENYNQVEIIGWLYQYYNQLEKDKAMATKSAYSKNEIPYVTQLFTPDWIVKYMVENSLGKFFVENISDKIDINNLKYYLESNCDSCEKKMNIEEIKFIDPCCGSGHILVYAFELFFKLYESQGYEKKSIPEKILKYNLYGTDIDDRAGQLSCLSVVLKAREYDKSFFNKDVIQNLNIISIQEEKQFIDIHSLGYDKEYCNEVSKLVDTYKNAKDLGSIIIADDIDYSDLESKIVNDDSIFSIELKNKILPLIKQNRILSQKYEIVVTNPPYMGASSMNNILRDYLKKNYDKSKADMFSVFVERSMNICKSDGYFSLIMPPSILFLGSFEKIRREFLERCSINSLLHMGRGIFGVDFGSTVFVMKNNSNSKKGKYFRLHERTFQMIIAEDIEKIFLKAKENNNIKYNFKKYVQNSYELGIDDNNGKQLVFEKSQNEFLDIPKSPIAYWISDSMMNLFESEYNIGKVCNVITGMTTADNERFLRYWYEISLEKMNLNGNIDNKKWIPYQKGGDYRKWYGNNELVVNWENKGYEIKHNIDKKTGKVRSGSYNEDLIGKSGITWSYISSAGFGTRYVPMGYHFDNKGSMIFTNDTDKYKYLAFLNSRLVKDILVLYNPTMSFQPGDVMKIPFNKKILNLENVEELVKENIDICKNEWDSYELSWDFKQHPLVSIKENRINNTFMNWNELTNKEFKILSNNEKEINNRINDILCIDDNHDDEDIILRVADRVRDIKSLISYAVGCMFGRYSLDEEGLVYAGGEFDSNKYKTFNVDFDNIIPITDESYFNDDIVTRFKQFIETVYGKETLNENMDYIAETLGKRGTETSEDTIRRYFVNDFYNDHIKTYQKRPIYWLFDSGKKNGFKCLIYMHRYSKDLVASIRTKYIPKVQTTYEKLLSDVEYRLSTELSLNDKKEMEKRKIELNGKIQEVKEYYEKIANVANRMIDIDLDDGVVVNYAKFTYLNPKTNKEESVLGKIK